MASFRNVALEHSFVRAQHQFFPATQLKSHAGAWDTLNDKLGGAPCLCASFVLVALEVFGEGNEILVAIGPANEPVAMAILVPERLGRWRTFQPSQMPMGAFLAPAASEMATTLAAILAALPGLALVLAVTQQDPARNVRPCDSAVMEVLDYIPTARVTIDKSFDDYWAARGKNLRQNVRKLVAKLSELGTPGHTETVVGGAEIADAIVEYGRIESQSWKSAGGTAIEAHNRQGEFYRRMLEGFAARGKARIFRFLIDGQVAAMDLCIENQGVLVVLKTTYDERFAKFSPATLLRHDYFQAIFGEGKVHTIEFYGRVMEWHTRWTDELRTLYHVNYYRWPSLRVVRQRIKMLRKPPPDASEV